MRGRKAASSRNEIVGETGPEKTNGTPPGRFSRLLSAVSAAAALSVLVGCATIPLTTQVAMTDRGPYARTAVFLPAPTVELRRIAEEEIVEALRARQAAPGRSVDLPGIPVTGDEMAARLKAAGYDSLLVIRRDPMVKLPNGDLDDWRRPAPPPSEKEDPLGFTSVDTFIQPGGREYANGRAWLVDLADDRVVWTARGTLGVDPGTRTRGSARAVGRAIVQKLAEDGVIGR